MNWDRWTYPPTDAEFHESFDDFEAAHLSVILLYASSSQQPSWILIIRTARSGRRLSGSAARWLVGGEQVPVGCSAVQCDPGSAHSQQPGDETRHRGYCCTAAAWLAVSLVARLSAAGRTDWHTSVHADWRQTVVCHQPTSLTTTSIVTNSPFARAAFLGVHCLELSSDGPGALQ